MSLNTTEHLLRDMEQLREHLGVDKWLLRGASWGAGQLAGLPGILIHGRNDLGGGACTPWELARAWPGTELVIIEDSGHTGSAAMTGAGDAAADRSGSASGPARLPPGTGRSWIGLPTTSQPTRG
jgi:pimeloyl-ACP methyl ester carboxylesterase